MKKIFFNCSLLAILCVGALGFQKKIMSTTSRFSGIMLENVEALTDVDLPEVVILCDTKGWGRCYVKLGIAMHGEYFYNPCRFEGHQTNYCPEPKYHG